MTWPKAWPQFALYAYSQNLTNRLSLSLFLIYFLFLVHLAQNIEQISSFDI